MVAFRYGRCGAVAARWMVMELLSEVGKIQRQTG
jgi:hypothetical protein